MKTEIIENNEIWKDIPDYEGLYQVSNLGNVKSLPKLRRNSKGEFITKELILTPFIRSIYLFVTLYKNGKYKKYNIHQLVGIAFLNHKMEGYKYVINHIDENPINNNLNNLEILTQRQNVIHSKDKSNTSSKYIGVSLIKKINKWQAYIGIKNQKVYLGTFDNEIDANLAYRKALNMYNNGDISFIKVQIPKSSKYKGISWHKRNKLWIAQLQINGVRKFLGYYKEEKDAVEAYQKALKN